MSTPTTTIPYTFSATSPPSPANYLTNLGLGYNLNVLMNMTHFAAGALEQWNKWQPCLQLFNKDSSNYSCKAFNKNIKNGLSSIVN